MDLPGTLGAPDQRYGGFGGNLGEGGSGLNDFFSAEDDAMERGQQEYLAGEISKLAHEILSDQLVTSYFFSYHGFGPGETKKIKRLLALINTTYAGHEIISRATNSKKDYQIRKGKTPERDPKTGVSTFNLESHPMINTVGGREHASSLRILAHELGHSVVGLYDNDDPALPRGNHMNNIDRVENPIVTALYGDKAARTTYGYVP